MGEALAAVGGEMTATISLFQVAVTVGGFILTGMLTLVLFFLRRLLREYDEGKTKLTLLEAEVRTFDERFTQLKLMVEQSFVSFDTFQQMRDEFRGSLREIYKGQSEQGAVLARLDERSKGDDRLAKVLEALPGVMTAAVGTAMAGLRQARRAS